MSGLADYSAETLLNTTPDAILVADDEGTITYANDCVRDVLGYEPGELQGASLDQVVPDNLDESALLERTCVDQRALGAGPGLEARRADGSMVPVDLNLSPLEYEGRGQIVIAIRDITEQHEHQQQITRLRKATRQLMDADTETEVFEIVATAATNIFGYESSVSRLVDNSNHLRPVAVEGGNTLELDERPLYELDGENPVASAYESGDIEHYDDIEALDDGHDRGNARSAMYAPIGTYGVLSVLDAEVGAFGEPDRELALSLTVNAETILDRIEHKYELQRQIDRLDEFAGVVSHDLRNPLNVAQLYADLATSTEATHLTKVTDALDRMEEIIEHTLLLARDGNTVGETEPVSINVIARQAWDQLDTADASLRFVDDVRVSADHEKLQHVFENLLDNAVDHGGADVRVQIGALADCSGFYVEDDGPGIAEAEREKVFERGYTTTTDGVGFGLMIVHEIVTAHGWDISVTDGSDGGARFEITGVDIVE